MAMNAVKKGIGSSCSDYTLTPKNLETKARLSYRANGRQPARPPMSTFYGESDGENVCSELNAEINTELAGPEGQAPAALIGAARHVQDLLDAPGAIIFSNLIKGPSWFKDEKECIEAAAIDMQGTILLDTLIRPSKPISDAEIATSYRHGITNEMLSSAPSWPEAFEKVRSTLSDASCVVTYSPEFTMAEFEESSNLWAIGALEWPEVEDLRRLEMAFADKWNQRFNIWKPDTLPGRSYRALFNCRACLTLMHEMAKNLKS